MNALVQIARAFGMNDEAWRRHANPWSVYTRFAAIPAMILAVWSRVWIGWWALIPALLVAVASSVLVVNLQLRLMSVAGDAQTAGKRPPPERRGRPAGRPQQQGRKRRR